MRDNGLLDKAAATALGLGRGGWHEDGSVHATGKVLLRYPDRVDKLLELHLGEVRLRELGLVVGF